MLINHLMKRAGVSPELVTFGAFYKDDKDDGCSVFLQKGQVANLQGFSDAVMKMAKGYHNQVGTCPEWATMAAVIDDLRNQTEQEVIPFLNTKFFGTTVRPGKSVHTVEVDLSDTNLLQAIVVFMANVAFLEDVGVIKSDNYNGMAFGNSYSKM